MNMENDSGVRFVVKRLGPEFGLRVYPYIVEMLSVGECADGGSSSFWPL